MVAAFCANDTDEDVEGDSLDLTLVGVPVDLGFETGAMLSWKNDTRFAQISSGIEFGESVGCTRYEGIQYFLSFSFSL